MKAVDQHRIQHDIRHRADGDIAHTDQRFALRRNKGVQPQRQLGKGCSETIDVHVVGRKGDGVGAGAKQQQDRPPDSQHDAGQKHGERKQHPGAASHNFFCLFVFALAKQNGRFRGAAHADQRRKSGNGRNDRGSHADTGKRLLSHLRDVSDEHFVHQIVKNIDELRCHRRYCQLEKGLWHRHGCKQMVAVVQKIILDGRTSGTESWAFHPHLCRIRRPIDRCSVKSARPKFPYPLENTLPWVEFHQMTCAPRYRWR